MRGIFFLVLCGVAVGAGGCAHAPASVAPSAPVAAADTGTSREEVLRELAKPDAEKKSAAKDDFIDVNDKGALRKTWPMALFIALIAAAIGAL